MSQLLQLDLPDGSETTAVLYEAENTKAVAIVFPAMGVYAKYYQPLASELVTKNITTALIDLRGNGNSNVRPSRKIDFGYSDQLNLDFNTAVSKLKSIYPNVPIYLFGHSLGGQLSCLYASKNPSKIDGLILSATCSVYHKGWNGLSAYRILAGTQFANVVARALGYFPGKKLGFGGTEAKTVIRDWSRQSRTGRYELSADEHDYETSLKKLKLPVLSISYQGDGLAPQGAVQHLLNKMASATKEDIHLKKSDPRNDNYDHFNWAKKPKGVVEIVSDWVGELEKK